MDDFRSHVLEGLEIFKRELVKSGSIPHVLLTVEPTRILNLEGLPRESWAPIARAVSKDVLGVFHITETWYKEVDKDYKGPPPSDCEQRKEAIMMEAKLRTGEELTFMQVFEHDWEGKIKFIGEPRETPAGRKVRSRVMDEVFT